MPIIKSAIKKVRKDRTRTARNKKREAALKALIKKVRASKTAKDLQATFSALDKAAKVHLIHPNKSARLKSRLSKLISQGVNITPKKSVKKTPVKKAK
ncbi:MAG: 30S ribosomal protein S20 [Candidatus Daviesbacteria bacterium]|nr:30S ribosomal protein S20 [Candidatus Daviesbacteria bacterium]